MDTNLGCSFGTFYYLCAVLDGATRFLVHREAREQMTEANGETILLRAREQYPDALAQRREHWHPT
ncbi:MAG: hypothetical protein M3Z05_13700 [Gemmatimonadota bacterium]|nr:hypothetical protein [Gemmatimonadota bacterium]